MEEHTCDAKLPHEAKMWLETRLTFNRWSALHRAISMNASSFSCSSGVTAVVTAGLIAVVPVGVTVLVAVGVALLSEGMAVVLDGCEYRSARRICCW